MKNTRLLLERERYLVSSRNNRESLGRSLHFYSTVFGMEEQFRDGDSLVFLRTPGARDTITLNEQADANHIARGGVDHIGFRLLDRRDLDTAILEVEAAGGRLIERGEREPGHSFAYVVDPDGHVIELYECRLTGSRVAQAESGFFMPPAVRLARNSHHHKDLQFINISQRWR